MKNQKLFKNAVLVLAFLAFISFTNQSHGQTKPGTWNVQSWFVETYNTVAADGTMSSMQLYGTNKSTQTVRVQAIKDGMVLPQSRVIKGVLFVFLTEFAFNRVIKDLQSGKRCEFRWDGAPATGYFRRYN